MSTSLIRRLRLLKRASTRRKAPEPDIQVELNRFSLSQDAKRVSLLELPNEILFLIIGYLSNADQRCFAGTCQLFRQLAEPILYQNLTFTLSSYFESSVFSAVSLASLHGQHVRSITVRPRPDNSNISKDDSSVQTWRARDGSVLPRSVAKEPWYTSPPKGSNTPRAWPRWFTKWFDTDIGLLRGENMPNLTKLVLHGDRWCGGELHILSRHLFYQAARNPMLRKLELGFWYCWHWTELLSLLSGKNVGRDEVEEHAQLLIWFASLQELVVELPWAYSGYGVHVYESYERGASDNMYKLMPYLKSMEALVIKADPKKPMCLQGESYTMLYRAPEDEVFHALKTLTLSGLQPGKGTQYLLSVAVPHLQTLILEHCLTVSPDKGGTSWASTFKTIAKYGNALRSFEFRNLSMNFHLDHQFGDVALREQARSVREERARDPGRMILPYLSPLISSDVLHVPAIDHPSTFSAFLEGADHLEYQNLMRLMAKRSGLEAESTRNAK